MADNYVINPGDTFLSGLFLGKDAGSSMVHPQLRQVVAQNQTRDAVRELAKIQTASVYGQREQLNQQREANQHTSQLNKGVQRMGERVSAELGQVSQGINQVSHGVAQVGVQVGQMSEVMRDGMERLDGTMQTLEHTTRVGFQQQALELKTGFSAMLTGLAYVDETLEEGFNGLANQREEHHGQLLGALDWGFRRVDESVTRAGAQVTQAVTQGTQAQVAAIGRGAQAQVQATAHGTRAQVQAIAHGAQAQVQATARGTQAQVQAIAQGTLAQVQAVAHGAQAQVQATARGTQALVQAIATGTQAQVQAIARSAQAQVAASEVSTQQLLHGQALQTQAQDANTQKLLHGQGLQTQALVDTLAAVAEHLGGKLDEVNHNLRHQEANKAQEHFLVGVRYVNRMDFARALEQFTKARETYAGHFATLCMEGFCERALGARDRARSAFESALSQAAVEPAQAERQRAWAEFCLGRLAFETGDYATAQQWHASAHRRNPELHSALVEEAASRLLDPARATRRTEEAATVRRAFKAQGGRAVRCWYALALTLAPLAVDLAVAAFRRGATTDLDAQRKDRVAVISVLWGLNPRTAGILLEHLEGEFPWLR